MDEEVYGPCLCHWRVNEAGETVGVYWCKLHGGRYIGDPPEEPS